MKRFMRYTLLLWLLFTVPVYANITIDGESVHVETDNYIVQFNKGIIEYIHNKLTDETYTLSVPHGKKGVTGLLFNRYFWERENILTRRADLISSTLIEPRRAELLFREEDTEVRLFIAVDTDTEDLLIDMEGESDTPGVIGIQWGISYLDIQNLSVIVPAGGGQIIDATSPIKYRSYPYPFSGAGWEAQLAIVQGNSGGFYVRNTDNTFQFKQFVYDRLDNGVALNFGTHNQAPFDTYTTGSTKLWRFNTYVGDWRVPARLYRDWMEQAFDAKRLSEKAAWLEDITLFVGSARSNVSLWHTKFLDALATWVDPTKTVVMAKHWSNAQEWSRTPYAHHPIYDPMPELESFLEVAKRHGFPVILYSDMHAFSPENPLFPEFMQYQYRDPWTGERLGNALMNPASSAFRELLVSQLKAVWDAYDFAGFFMDTSYYTINDGNGLIDGLNSVQGGVALYEELGEAMPGAIFMGERLHEGTFAFESFAQRPIVRNVTSHPISTFLFSPFTHAISDAPVNADRDPVTHQEILDYNEIVGVMPTLNAWDATQLLRPEYVGTQKVLAMARGWQQRYGLNGDVNDDGRVNILDLTLVAQNFGVIPLTHRQADIDGDGVVDVLDLILVANMFEGATIAR